MKKKLKIKDDQLKDVGRSLAFLRKNERLTDLRFVCKSNHIANAHIDLFREASPFMAKIYDISKEKQPFEKVTISLEDVDISIVNKMMEIVYLGQTTVSKKDKSQVEALFKSLGLDIPLTPVDSDGSSSASEEAKKSNKKSEVRKVSDDSDSSISSGQSRKTKKKASSNGTEGADQLKDEAKNNLMAPKLRRLEERDDADIKKFYKDEDATADEPVSSAPKLALNPFHRSATTSKVKSTPQKRRLAEPDKKVVSKASKKPRQEDSSSGDDTDLERAKSARDKEIPTSAKIRARKSSESSTEDSKGGEGGGKKGRKEPEKNMQPPAKASSGPAKKPGPKSKAKIGPASRSSSNNASNAEKKAGQQQQQPSSKNKSALSSMHVDGGITCCDTCDKIFISREAYVAHHKEVHEKAPIGLASPSSDSDVNPNNTTTEKLKKDKNSSDEEDAKAVKNKPGPRTKKSKAKITEERRRSTKSSTSQSDDDEEEVEKPKLTKIKKPGPKSKMTTPSILSKENKKPSSTPVAAVVPKLTPKKTPKIGPASKLKKSEAQIKSKISSSSDSESNDEGSKKDTKKTPPPFKLKISAPTATTPGSTKKARRPSDVSVVNTGNSYCRFCPSSYDKNSNLKNHVLNHFKEKLLKELPSCLPFLCPLCRSPSRDKITLLRHYAFGHKQIFNYCAKDDLEPRPKGHPIREVPNSGPGASSATPSSATKKSRPGPASSTKKARKSPEKTLKDSDSDSDVPKKKSVRTSPEKILPDLTDSDSDIPKKKPVTEPKITNGGEEKEEKTEEKNEESSPAAKKKGGLVFSSDEDDDLTKVVKQVNEATSSKTFDDLFGDKSEKEKKDEEKTPQEEEKVQEENSEKKSEKENEDENKKDEANHDEKEEKSGEEKEATSTTEEKANEDE